MSARACKTAGVAPRTRRRQPEVIDTSNNDALERGNATGRATRELLMILGERLFAERGIEGVSLREIGLEAGQRNNNVIQYHFGDRDGLVGAIYALRSEELDRRRHELIDRYEAENTEDDPAGLLRILLQPHAESLADPDNHFLGFLARLMLDIGSIANQHSGRAAPHMEAHNQLRERIRLCSGRVSRGAFDRRFDMMFNFAVTTMAVQRTLNKRHESAPVDDLLDEVVTIMVAGLVAEPGRAPQPRRTR